MKFNRRDFLKLTGFGVAASTVGCASNGGSSESLAESELTALRNSISGENARGWAAWQGRKQVVAWNSDARGPALSITKAIAALAVCRAVREGLLEVNEQVALSVPSWRSDARKSKITLLMLLQQTSGLDAGVISLYRNRPADKGAAALALDCVDPPGQVFRYGPSHWEVLAEVLVRKLKIRGESLSSFMERAVMRPIGLNRQKWRADRSGVPYFSTGTELNCEELGRLGETIRHLITGDSSDGLRAGDFAQVTQVSTANPMFGGGLWRNTAARRAQSRAIDVERYLDQPQSSGFWRSACLSNQQDPEMVALIGSGGRRVFVWPSQRKIVTRLGSSSSWSDIRFLAKSS